METETTLSTVKKILGDLNIKYEHLTDTEISLLRSEALIEHKLSKDLIDKLDRLDLIRCVFYWETEHKKMQNALITYKNSVEKADRTSQQRGMFAGMAMQGLCAHGHIQTGHEHEVAKEAVIQADALVLALNERKTYE